jgi:hypothetical protein
MTLVGTQALFLHERLIVGALSDIEQADYEDSLRRLEPGLSTRELAEIAALERASGRLFQRVPELDALVIQETPLDNELVALWQNFYFRRASDSERRFRAKLDIDRDVVLEGRLSTSHLIGTTGDSEISGQKRLAMLAYVTGVEPERIELRPMFIGWRVVEGEGLDALTDRREVWPGQLDQFANMADSKPSKGDLQKVSAMPEEAVKQAFAEIIGEPFVPSDWGGESSDLCSTRLTRRGQPLSAAFAFKGPGQKGTLYISGMGKRGDQAMRLTREPADLLVVQHHTKVAPEVRNLMSALARSSGKYWSVIDGADTAAILGAYNKLPPDAKKPSS